MVLLQAVTCYSSGFCCRRATCAHCMCTHAAAHLCGVVAKPLEVEWPGAERVYGQPLGTHIAFCPCPEGLWCVLLLVLSGSFACLYLVSVHAEFVVLLVGPQDKVSLSQHCLLLCDRTPYFDTAQFGPIPSARPCTRRVPMWACRVDNTRTQHCNGGCKYMHARHGCDTAMTRGHCMLARVASCCWVWNPIVSLGACLSMGAGVVGWTTCGRQAIRACR